MTRVCLVGADNFLMLKPANDPVPINGEAVQQVLLARAFRSLGCSVSTVVNALDTDIDETIEGIRVLSAFKRHGGLPHLRLVHPRATGLFKALHEIDADIYFESPAGVLTGLAAAFCRWKKKKFIFRVASDIDCIPGQQLIKHWRDRKIFEYGLRRADVVSVQSSYQAQLLEKNYGLKGDIVNMALDEPQEDLDGERDIDVLWISNLKHVKRPDRLIALAKRLPDIKFTMIGGVVQDEKPLYASIEQEAANMPNVNFLGQIPYDQVNEYVAKAKVFLNTSDIEGFPNTFLQAWARKVPVVAYFDPDGLICNRGLGRRPANATEMCEALRELLNNEPERSRIGDKARDFALTQYSAVAAAEHYLRLCDV